ncbi:pentatricopeptide repeat-containing protein At5g44230-like [Henckelia pumila]|uniref:pentatricopeptide repeat-containing protein At5g44230-like n=1 Tax=Henckelia pumila TaxID=405737 RepID=UPI003C6E3BDC
MCQLGCVGAAAPGCDCHEFRSQCDCFQIDAYGKCGEVESSYLIFSRMEEKNVVSWNSMVVAYASASRMGDACQIFYQSPVNNVVFLECFDHGIRTKREGRKICHYSRKWWMKVSPNDITYVGALGACADLAVIGRGKQIHDRVFQIRSSTALEEGSKSMAVSLTCYLH